MWDVFCDFGDCQKMEHPSLDYGRKTQDLWKFILSINGDDLLLGFGLLWPVFAVFLTPDDIKYL